MSLKIRVNANGIKEFLKRFVRARIVPLLFDTKYTFPTFDGRNRQVNSTPRVRGTVTKARFPFKRNRLRCVRC